MKNNINTIPQTGSHCDTENASLVCGAIGYTQTIWSPVELRSEPQSGDNSPTWHGRHSLMSPGFKALVEFTTPTPP